MTLSINHLLVDAISLASFVRELMRHYTGEEVPDLKHQRRDFVERRRRPIAGIEEKLDHWRRQLLPLRGPPPFPTDYSASPPSMVSWATEHFRSAPDETRLRSVGAATSATSFTLNVAAYAAVLCPVGGAQRVIIGSSVACLDLRPSADMLGYFQDPIFLTVQVRPRDTLGSLIAPVREIFAEVRENVVPYLLLASAVNPDFARPRPWPGSEIAGALIERHLALGADIWAEAQAAFLAHGRDYGAPRELRDLLKSPQILSKTNLLLRATRANGAASAYCPHPNPLRSAVLAPQRRTGGCDRVGGVPPG